MSPLSVCRLPRYITRASPFPRAVLSPHNVSFPPSMRTESTEESVDDSTTASFPPGLNTMSWTSYSDRGSGSIVPFRTGRAVRRGSRSPVHGFQTSARPLDLKKHSVPRGRL